MMTKALNEQRRQARCRLGQGLCLALGLLLSLNGSLAGQQSGVATAQPVTLTCLSSAEDLDRQHCAADTSAGVLLQRSTGSSECLLGRTWGYDARGVWVSEGCSGEFLVAGAPVEKPAEIVEVPAEAPADSAEGTDEPVQQEASQQGDAVEQWGTFDPGKGFLVGRSKQGELSLSGYALVRYMNQMPADQTFTDHLGGEHPVKAREDIYSHRVLVWLNGWVGTPKLLYTIAFWTVNTTDQDALFGNIGYRFHKRFTLYGGINGNPGSRSMLGSHPYWLGHDRVMADEFFRPFFTQGIWANGELLPGLWYDVSVGNSSSILGTTAVQLDRDFTYGGSLWWMPTTKEFGPRGAYGDWEMHENVATRFGVSASRSPEQRYTSVGTASSNTALKLADSLNLFETGSLAPGVTVTNADYSLLAFDAGVKYRGIFFQTELYWRTLDGFVANGPLPVSEIEDSGFYVQAAFYPIPRKLELYAATSQIYGDKDAGFRNSSEYLAGLNYYLVASRNHRLNLQVIDVNRSPVNSTFGYYTGGQDGTTVSLAASVFF